MHLEKPYDDKMSSPIHDAWCMISQSYVIVLDDNSHYETAWEVSNHRYARAQRSLGAAAVKKKDVRIFYLTKSCAHDL